jgi:hypothetical protein
MIESTMTTIEVTRFNEIFTATDAVRLNAATASILSPLFPSMRHQNGLFPLDVPKLREDIKKLRAPEREQKHDEKGADEDATVESARVLADGALTCFLQRLGELAVQNNKTPEELYMDILQHAHRTAQPSSHATPPFFTVHLPDGRRILTQEVKIPVGARRPINLLPVNYDIVKG